MDIVSHVLKKDDIKWPNPYWIMENLNTCVLNEFTNKKNPVKFGWKMICKLPKQLNSTDLAADKDIFVVIILFYLSV